MIVIYDENGKIKRTLKGNYKKRRHNLENKLFIEVESQNVENKKVENGKLVDEGTS